MNSHGMDELKKAFVKEFRRCLIEHYGKIPSAAVIARDFTLASPTAIEPLSIETIRKWLHGVNLPQSARMRTLSNWIGFDASALDEAFKPAGDTNKTASFSTQKSIDREMIHLLQSFGELQESERETVLEIVDLYRRSKALKK
ncbi:hypothetical protein [Polynucleobacter sphagniphilus]|uniref:hypothetical protein n=1 Tax=Polynucleobacter sphagniphilus TaxID=1743169 RepID=UPI0024745D13|nr:hypothetical protein [Polynucleobacter sphagniphilus]MDH6299952.1 ABC-type ATPase with predicted acetyltransferase domain [Polynucleobacter sphagniphilus]